MRSTTQGKVGEPQNLQHRNQSHLDPRHENFLTLGTRGGEFPSIKPWLLPNSQRLLDSFFSLAVREPTEQVPRI